MYTPPSFQPRYRKSHAQKPGLSTLFPTAGQLGKSGSRGRGAASARWARLSTPGPRQEMPLSQDPWAALAQAAVLGFFPPHSHRPQSEASRASPARNSATHLNSTMSCYYSKRSTGLGVPALLFINCGSLGKQHTFLSLRVLICKMEKTNPFPAYFTIL